MEKVADIKLKVAIGLGGGGCIVEAIDIDENPQINADIDEYGGYLGDFFCEGAELPKEAGIYIFDGIANGIPWSDDMYRYIGTFSRIEI